MASRFTLLSEARVKAQERMKNAVISPVWSRNVEPFLEALRAEKVESMTTAGKEALPLIQESIRTLDFLLELKNSVITNSESGKNDPTYED